MEVHKNILGYEPSELEKVWLLRMELHDLCVSFITAIIEEFGDEGLKLCKELIKNRVGSLLLGYKRFFNILSNDAASIASMIIARRALLGEEYYVLEIGSKNCEIDIKYCPFIKTKSNVEVCEILSEGENTAAKLINPHARASCRRLTTKKRPQCRLSIVVD
ncbi:MAG: hypothetical protein ACUVXA_03320 [Candidatus Jordarchaeum sp.]|uniref:hypothetical protein n=1 Tax=Candidatus Jordarchaeum sp. TaxID=2823881 RepID=UPI00404B520C